MIRVNDLVCFEFAIQDCKGATGSGVSQIMDEAIFQRLAFFACLIRYLTHPEPCLGKYIVIPAHVHRAIQITARTFAVARLGFDDAAFQ